MDLQVNLSQETDFPSGFVVVGTKLSINSKAILRFENTSNKKIITKARHILKINDKEISNSKEYTVFPGLLVVPRDVEKVNELNTLMNETIKEMDYVIQSILEVFLKDGEKVLTDIHRCFFSGYKK